MIGARFLVSPTMMFGVAIRRNRSCLYHIHYLLATFGCVYLVRIRQSKYQVCGNIRLNYNLSHEISAILLSHIARLKGNLSVWELAGSSLFRTSRCTVFGYLRLAAYIEAHNCHFINPFRIISIRLIRLTGMPAPVSDTLQYVGSRVSVNV